MRRFSTTLAALLGLIGTIQADEIPLWPGPIPGEQGPPRPEKIDPPRANEQPTTTRVSYVGSPSIEVRQPAPDKRTGAAVIVAPGGGYNILAFDKEGTEVADWLNSIGVTAFVLKYRVPRRPGDAADQPPPGPLQDIQRAVSLVRSRADEWGIDPARVGVLGFSAGGNLAARAGTKFTTRAYEPVDPSDEQSCRPDFCILVYPAYLMAKDGSLVPDLPVSAETPPMFLAHAHNDPYSPENSIALYLALKKAGVPGELHVYESGGHGFGLRPSDKPASTWPGRCAEWMKSRGLLGSE